MPDTATEPGTGIVHTLTPAGATVCGKNADGWSRAVTSAQRMGLVLTCEACGE